MSKKTVPYRVVSSKFLGKSASGGYIYEITFNQSLVHTGRFTGIENGLNNYREDEVREYEENILKEAEIIRKRKSKLIK